MRLVIESQAQQSAAADGREESGEWQERRRRRKKKNAFFSDLCVCAVVSTGCVVHIAGDDCVLWWARKRVPNFPHYTMAHTA